jgi:hypothetical protein
VEWGGVRDPRGELGILGGDLAGVLGGGMRAERRGRRPRGRAGRRPCGCAGWQRAQRRRSAWWAATSRATRANITACGGLMGGGRSRPVYVCGSRGWFSFARWGLALSKSYIIERIWAVKFWCMYGSDPPDLTNCAFLY